MNAVCKCCGSTDLNRFAAPMQGRLVFVFSWENNFVSQGFGQINFFFQQPTTLNCLSTGGMCLLTMQGAFLSENLTTGMKNNFNVKRAVKSLKTAMSSRL